MTQLVTLNQEDTVQVEETKKVLLQSYEQYETILGVDGGYNEYIENIRVSLYNKNIDQVFLAKVDGEILGTLQLFLDAKTAYNIEGFDVEKPFIRLLAVSPKARNKGIARALLDETVVYLKQKGFKEVYLHTSAYMAAAVRLYERYGFERYTDYDFNKGDRLVTCYRYKFQ